MKTLKFTGWSKTFLYLIFSLFLINCQSDDDQNTSDEQTSLIGSWVVDNQGTIERTIITFIDNNNFMLLDDGIADDDGQPGLERGTYTWNSDTNILNTSITTDTSGEWGLSGLSTLTVTISGNNLSASVDGETVVFTKIQQSTSNNLIGSWLFGEAETTESSVIVFIDNSNYMIGDDGIADDSGQPGIERGSYSWDMSSNAFNATASTDTNGDWGFAPNGEGIITVNNNTLIYTSNVEGDSSTATRIDNE